MKYNVKISNISFDMELVSVEEVIKEVVPEVKKEIASEIKKVVSPEIKTDFTDEFYRLVRDPSVNEIYLEDQEYEIRWIKNTVISRPLKIYSKTTSTLVFGEENNASGQDGVLFTLSDGARLITDNVNFCQKKQLRSTSPFLPKLVNSVQNPSARWTCLIQNCDTTAKGRTGGFGIGFVYGGIKENHLALINFKHVGQGLIDGKNPYKDAVLYLTMKGVEADFSNNTEFGDYKQEVKGVVKDQTFTIQSDHSMNFFNNHFFTTDKNDNFATILHIGRFTFMIDDVEAVINEKQFRLRPIASGATRIRVLNNRIYTIGKESHAGDSFILDGKHYFCTSKNRDEYEIWCNYFKPTQSEIAYHPFVVADQKLMDGEYVVDWKSSFDLEYLSQDAWIIFKSNIFFGTTVKTKFGDGEVLKGQVMGHQLYNHDVISLWAENVKITGYYRQTQDNGKTLGYNMKNCVGFGDEFKPPVRVTTDEPMPKRITDLL